MTPLARIARSSAAFLASNMTRAAIAFGLTLALGRGPNSARKIALYAAAAESAVVGWSAVALAVQIAAAAALMPALGGAVAAIAVAVGEAAVWFPLRRAMKPDWPGRPVEPAVSAALYERDGHRATSN